MAAVFISESYRKCAAIFACSLQGQQYLEAVDDGAVVSANERQQGAPTREFVDQRSAVATAADQSLRRYGARARCFANCILNNQLAT
jgi:hypothetical protein